MKEIIEVKGKAKNVFKYVEMMKKHKGHVTLGELSKNMKKRWPKLNGQQRRLGQQPSRRKKL